MNAPARPTKPFAWSYSKLKNYETCGRRHHEIDLKKSFKEEESENLTWGHDLHEGMANAIGKGKPLPVTMKRYQDYVDVARKYAKLGTVKVEQKLAFGRDFKASSWFDNSTWFRAILDVAILIDDLAIILDWKTGKILEDSVQLGLSATTAFINYPQLERIQTSFIWIGNEATTNHLWTRKDLPSLWADLMPRVKRLEEAYYSQSYQPSPSGLCRKYCPVETCEYYGVGSR